MRRHVVRPPEIPWCAADLSGSELRYVTDAVAAGQVGPAGAFLTRFERAIAERTGVRHAVATSSGTTALHIAALVAGIRPGEDVVTTAWTFAATGNAIRHAGAHPITLDIDADHWQLDPSQLERFLTRRCTRSAGRLIDAATGRPVTVVMPVHVLGHPADPAAAFRQAVDRYQAEDSGSLLDELDVYSARLDRLLGSQDHPP
jgi:dTDP-4-amino-4,6-dideoxygalactose transaminase